MFHSTALKYLPMPIPIVWLARHEIVRIEHRLHRFLLTQQPLAVLDDRREGVDAGAEDIPDMG